MACDRMTFTFTLFFRCVQRLMKSTFLNGIHRCLISGTPIFFFFLLRVRDQSFVEPLGSQLWTTFFQSISPFCVVYYLKKKVKCFFIKGTVYTNPIFIKPYLCYFFGQKWFNSSGVFLVPVDHRRRGIPVYQFLCPYQCVVNFYVFLFHIFAIMNSKLIYLH